MNDQNRHACRRPETLLVKAFAIGILAGAILLMLPMCSRAHGWTDPLTALFTATSAACVTGLTVVDTGSYFSTAGQLVILALMQAGGLGIMSLGCFLLIVVGRGLSINGQIMLMDAMGTQRAFQLKSLLLRSAAFALLLEAAGALALAWRQTVAYGMPVRDAIRFGVFHSVSAFCNAGFALQPDSLKPWRSDGVVLGVIMALVVLGGIGFLVLFNVSSLRFWRRDRLRRGRLSFHTRLVLFVSLLLLLAGGAVFAALEWRRTLHDFNVPQKVLVSLFQAVTPRTAGFTVVDMDAVAPVTLLATMTLMFVGGSPSSTAGGIKTTTAAILVLVIVAVLRGRQDVQLWNRRIPDRLVREVLAIFMLSLLCVAIFFGALLITERVTLAGQPGYGVRLLFETVSAFGTVGLSSGITSGLSMAGKLLVVLLMFLGRVGPMALALTIGRRDVVQRIRLPEEEVLVG